MSVMIAGNFGQDLKRVLSKHESLAFVLHQPRLNFIRGNDAEKYRRHW
jgi:hypothetical protein